MDEPRRDDVIDRELRRVFAAGGGASAGAHLDAEVTAAWMERRLAPSAMQAVETHLADCIDCQGMVATLARLSDDVMAPEPPPWWQRLRAGWLIPATVAAAAGLVIWIAVPQQRSVPPAIAVSSAPQSATPSADVPPDAKTPVAVAPPGAPTDSASRAEQDSLGRFAQERSEPLRKAERQSPPGPAPLPPTALADKAADTAPPAEAARRDAAPQLEAERPPIDEQRRARDNRETTTVTGQTPAAPAPAAGAAPAREDSNTTASARSFGTLAAVRESRLAVATLTIVAPGNAARWRRVGDTFEFAARADAPFMTATLPVGADAIAAGAAPGGTVCWLVGRAGTVLVSTDGVRFARVATPAEMNLIGVAATDARTATVTAADGRRFRTTDAGQTWSTVP